MINTTTDKFGNRIFIGRYFSPKEIEPGSRWVSFDGDVVEVLGVDRCDLVRYRYDPPHEAVLYKENWFKFQCSFRLLVTSRGNFYGIEQDVGKGPWRAGSPPSIGWWPASYFDILSPETVRWWNGQTWSRLAYCRHDAETAAAIASVPDDWPRQVCWRERADWWPAHSRT